MIGTKPVQDERAPSSSSETADSDPFFQRLLDTARGASAVTPGGVAIGELVAFFGDDRTPLVRFPNQAGAAVQVRTVVQLHERQIGTRVVVAFEGPEFSGPIVLGTLVEREEPEKSKVVDVEVDGKRVVITARDQLVLQCGRASLTLTRAGKVLIQGEYVSTRSNGVNRIRGGTVEIN